jgi:two-component system NarL family sensor kinase
MEPMKQADEIAEAIKRLGRQEGTHVETWVSVALAFVLTVIGGVIFWRMRVAMAEVCAELGEATSARLLSVLSGAFLPFFALSAGCFLILVVTVLAMRWTRLHLERERRQAQLSDLVLRLVGKYQDENLSRISSWLHDGIGHGLVMQKMDIEYLKQKRSLGEEDGLRLIERLKELIGQTRGMAGMIYPHTLFQFGLRAALSNLIENFVRMAHQPVEREIGDIDGTCSDEVALLVFHIVQEALTNVAKHAQATRILVEIQCGGGRLNGSVSNNGRGVADGAAKPPGGIGLMVITERAKRLGGTVSIGADADWSYRLSFAFPVVCGSGFLHGAAVEK